VEGEITLQLFEPKDFSDWDTFVSQVLSISPTQQKTDGIPIYYPEFSSIGFVQCVIESYTGPKHVGKGLYHVKIKLAEWQPPPAVSIVSTPAKTLPNVAEDTPVRPPDPEIDALLTQIALLNKANQP
jgi:hypothetical protein